MMTDDVKFSLTDVDSDLKTFAVAPSSRFYDMKDLLNRVAEELKTSDDPNLTKETLVLRTLKKLTENVFRLSWSRVLETLRQGQCYFDFEAHVLLKRALAQSVSHYEEAIERIAAKDYVKKSDVDRLASALGMSFETNLDACRLFAVDGFAGFHDLKLYSHHFKCTTEEYKTLHVRAVRKLYDSLDDARQVYNVVERVLMSDEPVANDSAAAALYLSIVGHDRISAVRVWKFKERKQVIENLASKKNSNTEKSEKISKKRKHHDEKKVKLCDGEKKVKHGEKKSKLCEGQRKSNGLKLCDNIKKMSNDKQHPEEISKTIQENSLKEAHEKVLEDNTSEEEFYDESSSDEEKACLKTLIETAELIENRDNK